VQTPKQDLREKLFLSGLSADNVDSLPPDQTKYQEINMGGTFVTRTYSKDRKYRKPSLKVL
jgi:hypothetical protein